MEYDKINELFEPIFQWLKEHYPNGAYFLIDKNSAKLYAEESLSVYSEEIKNYAINSEFSKVLNKMSNSINKESSDTTFPFILNKNLLSI